MSARVTDQQGMTLAEVIIAVAILGVGLVALSSAVPLGAYGIQEGNQLSTATFLANQQMERVRNASWQAAVPPPPDPPTVPAVDNLGISATATAAPVGDGGVTFPDEKLVLDTSGVHTATSPPCTVTPVSGNGCYTRTVRIINCSVGAGCGTPPIVDAGLRQVTVTVSYRPMTGVGVAPAGTTKSAVVTMYISQR